MPNNDSRSRLLVMLVLIIVNMALILFAARFLKGYAPQAVLVTSIAIFGVGVLGLVIVTIMTSKVKQIFKVVSLLLVACLTGFFAWYYVKTHENVIESHYAIVVTPPATEDGEVGFAEYHFSDSFSLNRFLEGTQWYMNKEGDKQRREMVDYFYSIKAEEREMNKKLIPVYELSSVPPPDQNILLLAYVDEYRTGFMEVESNPTLHIGGDPSRQATVEE